ncbi:hypothetical protein Tco_0564562, partial [Tanacetum coccineum]
DYYFKEDYTIVPKPRAVVYRDRNDQRKLMRLNELHKFSDGTLTRVMEKLDHMVKDFHLFEYNKGMETRKWSEDDKRRSKDFITAIEKRLQIRRIYRSLESFVGGRIRDIDYRLINRTTRTVPKDRPCILLNWSYKVGKVRSISENKGKVPTEMELVLEYTQQGSSHEVSLVDIEQVAVSSSLRLLEPKCTIESRAKRSTINLVRTQHPSETLVFHNEDGNPARANIKQALGSYERPHKGVKASANSDVMYFFTSAQDGNQLQNDERLCLGDDLKGILESFNHGLLALDEFNQLRKQGLGLGNNMIAIAKESTEMEERVTRLVMEVDYAYKYVVIYVRLCALTGEVLLDMVGHTTILYYVYAHKFGHMSFLQAIDVVVDVAQGSRLGAWLRA